MLIQNYILFRNSNQKRFITVRNFAYIVSYYMAFLLQSIIIHYHIYHKLIRITTIYHLLIIIDHSTSISEIYDYICVFLSELVFNILFINMHFNLIPHILFIAIWEIHYYSTLTNYKAYVAVPLVSSAVKLAVPLISSAHLCNAARWSLTCRGKQTEGVGLGQALMFSVNMSFLCNYIMKYGQSW